MKTTEKDWICTDPNNEQYGRHIKDRTFEFKEKNHFHEFNEEGEWIEFEVNLDNYTEEEIDDHISPYYKDIEEIKEIYGDDWEWIVAECIFEQESGLY